MPDRTSLLSLLACLFLLARCDGGAMAPTREDLADVPPTDGASMDVRESPPPDATPLDTAPACVDMDHDGFPASECGGMPADCDDSNPAVHPTAPEVCDRADLDEDCDPCTVAGSGDGDGDHDTFLSGQCVNTWHGTAPTCPTAVRVGPGRVTGNDCNDLDGNVRPNQTEACNGVDDNCNGAVDEGVPVNRWYRDADRDGHGDLRAMPLESCGNPSTTAVSYATSNDDCDDADPLTHAGAEERCDGRHVDETCEGAIDEGCDCDTGADRSCLRAPMTPALGVCADGRQRCVAGRWGECSVQPSIEICNSRDDDCDGMTDESSTIPAGVTPPPGAISDAACGGISGARCTAGACRCAPGQESCDGVCRTTGAPCAVGVGACQRAGFTGCVGSSTGCLDATGRTVVAGAPSTETCNTLDDDCDGTADEGLHAPPEITFNAGTAGQGCVSYSDNTTCRETIHQLCAGRMAAAGYCATSTGFYYQSSSDFNRAYVQCIHFPTVATGGSIVHQEFAPIEMGTAFASQCAYTTSAGQTCKNIVNSACVGRGFVGGLYYVEQTGTTTRYFQTCFGSATAQSFSVSNADIRAVGTVMYGTPCSDSTSPYYSCAVAAHRYCTSRGFLFGLYTGAGNTTSTTILCLRSP